MRVDIFLKWFWLIAIGFNCINYIFYKIEIEKRVAEDESLREGYNKILKNAIIYFNIPWIIMGIGNMLKLTESMFDYIQPKISNPFSFLFYGYILYVILRLNYWVYFQNGVNVLVKYKGIIKGSEEISPRLVKPVLAIASIVFIVVFLYIYLTMPKIDISKYF